MKKGINLFLTIATSLSGVALVGCLTACPNNDNGGKPATLKETLKYICNNKNYTLVSGNSSVITPHQLVYTEKYMGRDSQSSEELVRLYNSDEGGTYCIEFSQDKYVGSEYKSDKNVWESNLFPSLYKQSEKFINSIKDDATSVKITDKNYKINFVQMIGYNSTDVLKLSDLTATYSDSTGLVFTAKYNSVNIIYTLNRMGTSKSEVVENYVSQGGAAYVPTKEQKDMRNAMKGNNYAQEIYNFGSTEETTGYVGYYAFSEHFFFTKYNNGNDYSGYISLNCPENTSEEDKHPALHGIYLFSVVDGKLSLNPNYIANNPDIVEVMNYPSNLLLWDNLQLLESWKGKYVTGYEKKGTGYSTTNPKLLSDFSKNFNMSQSFSGQQPIALSIDIIYAESGALEKIYFYYTMSAGGVQYVYPIPFYAFGKVANASLEQVYEHYNYTAEN